MGTYGWPTPGGGLADERFITGGDAPELSNEISLGGLASGLLRIVTAAGVITSTATIAPGADNTFLRSSAGVMAFAAITGAMVTGITATRIPYGHTDATLTHSAELTYDTSTATLDLVKSRSGAAVTLKARNSSNTASSSAVIQAEVAGSSAGNAVFQSVVAGGQTWTWGIDRGSSNRFAINPSAALGTADALTIGTNGFIGIGGAPNASYLLSSATSSANLLGVFSSGTSVRASVDVIGGGSAQLSSVAYGSVHAGTVFGETKAGLVSLEGYPSASNGMHIGVSGSTFLAFTTNSARRMTIAGTGEVSIGPAAPVAGILFSANGTGTVLGEITTTSNSLAASLTIGSAARTVVFQIAGSGLAGNTTYGEPRADLVNIQSANAGRMAFAFGTVMRAVIDVTGGLGVVPFGINRAWVGGVVKTIQTDAGNITTGVDTIATYSLPAGVLAVDGQSVEIEAVVTFAANGNNKQAILKFGGTTVADTGVLTQNGGSLIMRGRIVRTAAATQKGAFLLSAGTYIAPQTSAPAETLSGAITILLTAEGTNTDDIVCKSLKAEWKPAFN